MIYQNFKNTSNRSQTIFPLQYTVQGIIEWKHRRHTVTTVTRIAKCLRAFHELEIAVWAYIHLASWAWRWCLDRGSNYVKLVLSSEGMFRADLHMCWYWDSRATALSCEPLGQRIVLCIRLIYDKIHQHSLINTRLLLKTELTFYINTYILRTKYKKKINDRYEIIWVKNKLNGILVPTTYSRRWEDNKNIQKSIPIVVYSLYLKLYVTYYSRIVLSNYVFNYFFYNIQKELIENVLNLIFKNGPKNNKEKIVIT